MTVARSLKSHWVEKPWGVDELPGAFGSAGGRRIGEIWFGHPDETEAPLLVKYLFTSEALSIQVHPGDVLARRLGLPRGKAECWYVVDAEPGAVLGIGTTRPLAADELRAVSLSGEIEALMQWHPVRPGMFVHIPPGTVHAIGAGISLIEVQQNSDATFRLYDYGRPRPLHLDEGVAASRAEPFAANGLQMVDPERSIILLESAAFTLAHIVGQDLRPLEGADGPLLVIPLGQPMRVGEISVGPGECLRAVDARGWDAAAAACALVAWPAAAHPSKA